MASAMADLVKALAGGTKPDPQLPKADDATEAERAKAKAAQADDAPPTAPDKPPLGVADINALLTLNDTLKDLPEELHGPINDLLEKSGPQGALTMAQFTAKAIATVPPSDTPAVAPAVGSANYLPTNRRELAQLCKDDRKRFHEIMSPTHPFDDTNLPH